LYPNISKRARFDQNGKLLCGPVILKVDSGPGRLVANAESIRKQEDFMERGLLIMLGLPNATSVNQEMDALFQGFKTASYARGEILLTERMKKRGELRTVRREFNAEENEEDGNKATGCTRLVTMGYEDLATVVYGTEDDTIDNKPFYCHFTKGKILQSWAKIGLVPFTRKCLQNQRVRHELGQGLRNESLEVLQEHYNRLVQDAHEDGLNAGIFDAAIPVAKQVNRQADEDEQVRQLVSSKGSFSASALWNNVGTRIGNSKVVLRAQKEQMALEEAKIAAVANSKLERRAKNLESAQQALQKYLQTPWSMSDKDWIDITRWVLPEAKVDFRMKDLQKKDAIIAKLASLPRDWKSYIPQPV